MEHSMSTLTTLLRWSTVAVLLLALAAAQPASPTAHASGNPCSDASPNPGVPGEDPEPTIAGDITDTSGAVSGATVYLYRCADSTPVLDDTEVTGSSGHYAFASLIQAWYFVEVSMTGPLTGKVPSQGTENPSPLIEVGEGDPDLDFAFQ